jgi:hypothetical protein
MVAPLVYKRGLDEVSGIGNSFHSRWSGLSPNDGSVRAEPDVALVVFDPAVRFREHGCWLAMRQIQQHLTNVAFGRHCEKRSPIADFPPGG